jgi:hypothetical protein
MAIDEIPAGTQEHVACRLPSVGDQELVTPLAQGHNAQRFESFAWGRPSLLSLRSPLSLREAAQLSGDPRVDHLQKKFLNHNSFMMHFKLCGSTKI